MYDEDVVCFFVNKLTPKNRIKPDDVIEFNMIAATNFSTYLESKVRKTLMLQHKSHF